MTKRTTEQILRELLYLAAPDSSEEARSAAAEAIAERGDEALPADDVSRLAEVLRSRAPEDEDAGERVALRGADLARANLYQVRLNGAELTDADLTEADLSFSYLRGARLDAATLTGADLTGADLTDADLRGAVLRRADLTGAWLRRARLDQADLHDCDLTDADLKTASGALSIEGLGGVRWSADTRWPQSQPGLGSELLDRSVRLAPGIYRVGGDDGRDRSTGTAPGPGAPEPSGPGTPDPASPWGFSNSGTPGSGARSKRGG
ncbi:pentapeptide repeat-containing protein [Streptomyces sp. NPDC054940]